jgi:hypothetical protein
MRHGRLTVPVILAVTSVALASCVTPPPPDDVPDATVADVTDIDSCPDPLACISDFQRLGDGSIQLIYRRSDGSVSTEPCPQPPPGCLVA